MLTRTNNFKYITLPIADFAFYLYAILPKSILEKINKDSNNLSKILEMRITFVSNSRFMTYKYCLKKENPCVKLN